MTEPGLLKCGVASAEERAGIPGVPSAARRKRGAVAVLECVQGIPCNPCESACPRHAITVGMPITNRPSINEELCIGCGLCVAACPGLAIFIVDESGTDGKASVTLPYEYPDMPETGETVCVLNRYGKPVGEGVILAKKCPASFAKTTVLTVSVDAALADEARNIRRKA